MAFVDYFLQLTCVQMCVSAHTADTYYSSFYEEGDYPVSKTLRDPVYVQVALMNRRDPLASLILDRCWATAHPSPHSMPQWDILIDG